MTPSRPSLLLASAILATLPLLGTAGAFPIPPDANLCWGQAFVRVDYWPSVMVSLEQGTYLYIYYNAWTGDRDVHGHTVPTTSSWSSCLAKCETNWQSPDCLQTWPPLS